MLHTVAPWFAGANPACVSPADYLPQSTSKCLSSPPVSPAIYRCREYQPIRLMQFRWRVTSDTDQPLPLPSFALTHVVVGRHGQCVQCGSFALFLQFPCSLSKLVV